MEEDIKLIVSERDGELVNILIPECQKEYEELMQKETGRVYKCKLELDTKEKLKPADLGGVVLITRDGRIVCRNTAESKLLLSYDELLPNIRAVLFPFKSK